jgi:hypothetical protein
MHRHRYISLFQQFLYGLFLCFFHSTLVSLTAFAMVACQPALRTDQQNEAPEIVSLFRFNEFHAGERENAVEMDD